jgi:hypothetical protein
MHRKTLVALVAWTLGLATSNANELSGYVSAEADLFFHAPLYAGQEHHSGSVAAQPEYYHEWENGSSVTFIPFGRWDSADPERTHADIRELNYVYRRDNWYFRVGIGKVFWGATEFVHLVDIVNQTDLVENIDGEDKLGQPMIEFSISPSWGTLEFFALPFFRERTFPGRRGRLRPGPLIDTDSTIYQSTAGKNDMDVAIRYSRTIGSADVGVYFFHGTNRDPWLIPSQLVNPGAPGPPTLIPFYERIKQVGADMQYATGNWLWKLEAFYRNGYVDDFFAATGGVEYTFFNVRGSNMDVGVLGEYAYDERGDNAITPFQNDAFLGLRLAPNDTAGTQLLVGYGQDLDGRENAARIEASRRLSPHWKLMLEAWLFMDTVPGSIQDSLRDDDFARLELAYFF